MSRFTARQILNMSLEEIWKIPLGRYDVEFEDGVVIEGTFSRSIIFSWHFWDLYRDYPNTPITSRCYVDSVIGDGSFNDKTHTKLMERIFVEIVHHEKLFSNDSKQPLLRNVARVNNVGYFNNLIQSLSSYVTTIDATDFVNLVNDPEVSEINDRISDSPASIDNCYKELYAWLNTTDKHRRIVDGTRCGASRLSSFNQCVGPRGYVTDLDRTVFTTAIKRGFIKGFRTLYDLMAESRTAAKALNAAGASIQKSEYASRRFQILTMSVTHPVYTDCGSTDYKTVIMEDRYLPYFKGKWYVNEETGELNEFMGTETHLVGKNVRYRSALTCHYHDRHKICTTCLGTISNNLKSNTNLGYEVSSYVMEKITQRILSFKHLVQSVAANVIDLDQSATPYLKANTSELSFKKDVDTDKLYLILNGRKLHKLVVALSIETADIQLTKVGDIDEIVFATKPGEDNVRVKVNDGDSLANITRELLEFIKSSEYQVDDRGNYIIPLKGWDKDDPLFDIPLKEEDVTAFVSAGEKLIEGGSRKTLTIDQHFSKLFDLFMDQAPTNIMVLEVMTYAISVFNPQEGNYRLGRNSPLRKFAGVLDIMNNRSLGAFLIYERQAQQLNKKPVTMLDKRYRQAHPMDVLFAPQEVVNAYQLEKAKRV